MATSQRGGAAPRRTGATPPRGVPLAFRAAVVAAVVVAGLTACGGSPASQGSPVTTVVTGPNQAQDTGTAQPAADEAAMLEDIDAAVSIVGQYWEDHWSEFFTGEYTPPEVVGFYDGGTSTAPTCDGERLEEGNAFYCGERDYIAWDRSLMAAGYASGDSWVYLVVAHEWGHAIQARLSEELVAAQLELQADCLAGAVLYGAEEDGTLLFEEGDHRELAAGLVNLGDELPWTMNNDHGDSFQRVQAFDLGRNSGVEGCFAEM